MVIIGARLASVIGHDRGGRIFLWIRRAELDWAALSIGSQIPKAGSFIFENLTKIQIQNHNGIKKCHQHPWIPCSRDKGSSSSSLIITSALALYLRYFSSGWTPTRNLRSNTCLQKISEFPLKKHMPSQFCLLSFIFRVTAAISVIQHQDQLLCTITSIVSLFSFWSDLSLER